MDRQGFLALAATVWDACEEAVTLASSGQAIRETEGVFRERFLELARRAAPRAPLRYVRNYQERTNSPAFRERLAGCAGTPAPLKISLQCVRW
jgi:hypothetical protein